MTYTDLNSDIDEELEDDTLDDSDRGVGNFLDKARQNSGINSGDRLVYLMFGTFLMSSAALFIGLISIFLYFRLDGKPLPSLVQTSDGKTIRVLAQGGEARSPEVIKSTTVVALKKLFDWRPFIIPTNAQDAISPRPDPGIEIPAKGTIPGGRIPTTVYEGSFILEKDFQESFLSQLAPLIKEAEIFTSGAQVSLEIANVSKNPISLGDGLWKVDVVGTLVRVLPNKSISRAKFNKQIFLKAIEPSVISDQGTTASESMLSRLVAEGSATGLKIYAMKDLNEKDLNLYPKSSTPAASPPATLAPSPSPLPSAPLK
jgi:hypothetical protein